MGFEELQARYRRLHQESEAWRLLRADNAPIIVAFLVELFSEENEVPFGRAKVVLEANILWARKSGGWETGTTAGAYLNQWINYG